MYDLKKDKLYTKEQKSNILSSDFVKNTGQQSLLPNEMSKDMTNASLQDFEEENFEEENIDSRELSDNKEAKLTKDTKAALKKYEASTKVSEEEEYEEYADYSDDIEDIEVASDLEVSLYDASLYSSDDYNDFAYNEEEKEELAIPQAKAKKSKKEAAPQTCIEFEKGTRAWDEFNNKEQEIIVKHYAPKIRFIALRMKGKLPKHIELNELISSGTVGLIEALKKFKPQLGIRFDSYAESRIRGAMIDELRRLDWFPRSLRTKAKEIKQAIWNLEHEIGRTPTTFELAEFTGLPEKEIESTLEAIDGQLCLSLDSIQETMASVNNSGNEENPYQSTAFAELVDKVAGLIDTLTPREKLVLSLYYNDELNMREASEVMEVTEGRVSQLHTQAINKLRKIFAEQYHDSL